METQEGTRENVSPARVSLLVTALTLASLPAIVDPGALSRSLVAFSQGHTTASLALSYGWAPVVAISACILFMAPGLITAIAMGHAAGTGAWLLSAFASSLVTISATAAAVQGATGAPLTGASFVASIVAISIAATLLLLKRSRVKELPWPLAEPEQAGMLAWITGGCAVILVVLFPKFVWENFNGDGAHTLESSRLLLRQSVPFWGQAAGNVSAWPGTSTMLFTYPISWFTRLVGPIEAAARLPLLIYLALFTAGIGMLANQAGRRLASWDHALLWLGVTSFTIGMAYSATYSPYSADLALSLSQDVLVTACLIGALAWSEAGSKGMTILFGVFATLAAPNGLLLLILAVAGIVVANRGPGRSPALADAARWIAISVVASITISVSLPLLLAASGLPAPGGEHGPLGILRRFAFLQATDLRRFIYMIVPGGILPALTMALWPRMDRMTRALTLITVGYFLVFYVQAHLALHHFIPAMLIPLAIFWQGIIPRDVGARKKWRGALAVSSTAALVLSLPPVWAVDTTARRVGAAIDNRLPGYDRVDPALFNQIDIFSRLFPFDWDARVPQQSLGGSPLVWNYYSFNSGGLGREGKYLLQPDTVPAPAGATSVTSIDGASLFVLDTAEWVRHRSLRPPTPVGSPLYIVPRWVMFRSVQPDGGFFVLSVVDVLGRMGVDTARLLQRLGAK